MKKIINGAAAAILAGILAANGGVSAMTMAAIAEAPAENSASTIAYSPSSPAGSNELDSETLTAAILRYKTIFGSTDGYTNFYHDYSEYDGFTSINLRWSNDNENIEFGVTDGGTVFSYDKYSNDRNYNYNVIPLITKDKALSLALEWAKKINPEYADYLSAEHATVNYRRNGTYRINLYAYIDGKQLGGDQFITAAITADGKLTSYDSGSMPSKLGTPSDDGKTVISTNSAENKLAAAVPFRLVYRTFYSYDEKENRSKAEVKLVYMPGDGFGDTVIDAVSGKTLEVISPDGLIYPAAGNSMVTADSVAETEQAADLTPVEQSAVEMQDSFLTVEAIKSLLVKNELLDFDEKYEFEKTYVSKNVSAYTEKERYVRNIVWKMQQGDDTSWAGVTCDAETGEIFNFYSGNAVKRAEKAENGMGTMSAGVAAAQAFKALSSYADEYKAGDLYIDDYYSMLTQSYSRYNEDTEVLGDTASITINPETGLVTRYNINRIDAQLESVKTAIGADKAAKAYFKEIGIKLVYIAAESVADGKLTLPVSYINNNAKTPELVYAYGDSCLIDAKTGEILNYSGEKYVKNETAHFTPAVFSDVDSSMYQVALLFNMDILEGADKFYPEKAITEADFNELLENAVSQSKAVTDGETTADKISRQQAAKLIVESLGYGEIAALDGIYKLPFDDGGKVGSEYTGYVAIAYALGLFKVIGDEFDPSAELTRGEAACMVCSYIEYAAKAN